MHFQVERTVKLGYFFGSFESYLKNLNKNFISFGKTQS